MATGAGRSYAGAVRLAELVDPRPVRVPQVVTASDVGGSASWQDLLRQGALTPLSDASPDDGASAVITGTRLTPTHRALATLMLAGGTLPRRAVLAGVSAAWVHTCLYDGVPVTRLRSGDRLELAHDASVHRPDAPARAVVRCSAALTRDIVLVAGVPITSPARTAADVACRLPFRHAVAILTALAAGSPDAPPVDLDAVGRALEVRSRVVGRPAARRALAAATRR